MTKEATWRCAHGWLRGEQCELCKETMTKDKALKLDIPDFIAGAFGVSRGTAYDMMREALAQPEEEKLHPVHIGVDVTKEGTAVTAFYRKHDAVMEMFYSQFHPLAQPEQEPMAKVVSTAPDRIWLDLGFDPQDEYEVIFHELHDVTWSQDNASGNGIEYVRADTTSPKRPWVGLTRREVEWCFDDANGSDVVAAKNIEAALRSKNT